MYDIEMYKTTAGKEPFTEWLKDLDRAIRSKINARLTRIRDTGNFGMCEPVGEGVFELKFDFGPGYRVYFGYKEKTVLLLLLGGDKKPQQKDINKAKGYWEDHLSSKKAKK